MTLLSPLGLALGLLGVPVVAMYFLKIRRQRITVPSALPWRTFQRSEKLAAPFQRFRQNLLLWLQLLLLLLLAVALARPAFDADVAPGHAVVLVIDVSASMGATDGSPTRLDAALSQAKDVVARLGSADPVMVVVAGANTDVRVPFTTDHGAVVGALGKIRLEGSEGSLAQGLDLALSLARAQPGVEIVVLSDGGASEVVPVDPGEVPVRYVKIGQSGENTGLANLDVRRAPANDDDRQLFVTIQTFGAKPVRASVTVDLDGVSVGVQATDVVPGAPTAMVFDLPSGADGLLRVVLEAPGDRLPSDDVAWAVVAPVEEKRLLLVGVDGLTARALRADPRVVASAVSAAGFKPEMLDQADAVVFGELPSPAPPLDGRSYAILAPADGGPVRFGAEVKGPEVLGWRRTHPTQRFVEWDGVVVARARAVADQGGLAAIVEGTSGPLVLAGERGGGRVVQLAFQPLESDLPLRVAWPVFLLDTVGWLAEQAADVDSGRILAAGQAFVRRVPLSVPPEQVTVVGPDGPVEVDVADGVLRVHETTRPGVYRVTIAGVESAFTANALSVAESRILPRESLSFGGGATPGLALARADAGVGQREAWPWIAAAALVVLLVEWLAYHLRRVA